MHINSHFFFLSFWEKGLIVWEKSQMSAENLPEVKMVLLGGSAIGAKTSLVIQLLQNHFLDEYDPTIEDSYRKVFTINGQSVCADILGLLFFSYVFPSYVI